MNTTMLLMAQYNTAIVPLETVCRDYFRHLTVKKLSEKIARGEISLPLTRIEDSQRAAKGVHISHLSAWIDARMMKAEKEARQVMSAQSPSP